MGSRGGQWFYSEVWRVWEVGGVEVSLGLALVLNRWRLLLRVLEGHGPSASPPGPSPPR